jgi:glycerol uptake facilitator-like aquaporin
MAYGRQVGDLCAVGNSDDLFRIFLAEVIFTYIFVNTILSIIYAKLDNKLAGTIIIVFTLMMCITAAAPVSGGCINPAIGIA